MLQISVQTYTVERMVGKGLLDALSCLVTLAALCGMGKPIYYAGKL